MKSRTSILLIVSGILFVLWMASDFPVFARNGDSLNVENLPVDTLDAISSQVGTIQTYINGKLSGNLAFMSQNGENTEIVIWDNETRDWYSIMLSGEPKDLIESNGNICGYAQSGRKIQITAWNKQTKEFSPVVEYADSAEIVPCDSNFAFYTSSQKAAVWTPQTDRWRDFQIPGKIVKIAGTDDSYAVGLK